MINPIISWTDDTDIGFFVNITGNLSSIGAIWNGTIQSPTGRWQLTYPVTAVIPILPAPNILFGYTFPNLSGKQLYGPLSFTSGAGLGYNFGGPIWGAQTGANWIFSANGGNAPGWTGNATIAFTSCVDATKFATWRYSIDISINNS